MQTRLLLMGWMLALALSPIAAQAEGPATKLSADMKAINTPFKALSNEHDPAKGAALAREAQQGVLKAAAAVPATINEMADPEARAAAAAEYRLMIGKLFVALCEVEQAFLAKDLPKVATLIDGIKAMKKAGHAKFVKED